MVTLTGTSAPACIGIGLFSYQFGGSERVAVDLAHEFSRRGHKVVCFAFHDSTGPFRSELEKSGIRCLDLNYGSLRGPLRRLRYYVALWRMLRRERITCLHVHHHGALILCGPPAWLSGIGRVVMTEHGLQALIERPQARTLTRRYARFATDITVVEPGQAEYFERVLNIPPTKIHCIANGVRVQPREEAARHRMRSTLAISQDSFAYFYIGRLNPVKDLPNLLHAYSLLPAQLRQRARLFIVGDGSERRALEQLSAKLEIDQSVTFLGARSDVSSLLAAADAFVMSSRSEGLPMALLEAMAAGVPCVATAVGGIPTLFEGNAGIAVAPENALELSGAMTRVADSDALRNLLSANGLGAIRSKYSMDDIVQQYLYLLGVSDDGRSRSQP